MSIAGINIVVVTGLCCRHATAPTVVAVIKRRRFPSARRRRESSRWRRGLALYFPLHSSYSVAVAISAIDVAVATVPSRVFIVAMAVGSVAPDCGSGDAPGASATTALSSATMLLTGPRTRQRWQCTRTAAAELTAGRTASVVAAVRIGITMATMPMAIAVAVAVPILVGWQRRSR